MRGSNLLLVMKSGREMPESDIAIKQILLNQKQKVEHDNFHFQSKLNNLWWLQYVFVFSSATL
jgi:hypothetical protein